jgi:hypothetical protein
MRAVSIDRRERDRSITGFDLHALVSQKFDTEYGRKESRDRFGRVSIDRDERDPIPREATQDLLRGSPSSVSSF